MTLMNVRICREEQLPKGSLQVAESQAQLAGILQRLGDQQQAVELLRSSLAAREKVLGLQHPLTIATLSGM